MAGRLRLTGPRDHLNVGFTYVSAARFPVHRNLIEFSNSLTRLDVTRFAFGELKSVQLKLDVITLVGNDQRSVEHLSGTGSGVETRRCCEAMAGMADACVARALPRRSRATWRE